MRSSHIADWFLLFLPCPWVNHSDNTIYPGTLQDSTYCHVELEVKTSGEKRFVLTMVMAIDNSHRLRDKRNPYNSTLLALGLDGDIFQNTVNDVLGGESHKITMTAAYHALEHEHVPILCKFGIIRQVAG